MVQLSHLYMTTGKTMVLPIQTFVHKGMSLFFNKTWIFIFNSVFLNYSTAMKAHTEEDLKVVENLKKFLFEII